MSVSPNNRNSTASNGQLPSLTSLRGVAALWVVLYHYCVQCFPNLDPAQYTHLVSKGYLAVDMFFMLSGFVMTHVYHRAFASAGNIKTHYRSFLVARVARLYPLHVFVLFLFVATALAAHWLAAGSAAASFRDIPWTGPESVTALFANLLMLQGLNAGKLSWNYPAWSISVECMAYLAFPVLLPMIWRASKGGKCVIALALCTALVWLTVLARGNFDQWDGPMALLRCIPEFLLGTLLYCAYRIGPESVWLNRDSVAVAIVAATVLCLHLGAPDLLIVALFAALIPLSVVNTGRFSKVANARPLLWLGEISYSLYLIYGFIKFAAAKILPGFGIQNNAELSNGWSLALMLGMVAVCLLVATATYSGVETGSRVLAASPAGKSAQETAGSARQSLRAGGSGAAQVRHASSPDNALRARKGGLS